MSLANESRINLISYKTQTYDWGKPASESLVFSLSKDSAERNPSTSEFNSILAEKNISNSYAELWLGTHPNGPSSIILNNINLNDSSQYGTISLSSYLKSKQIYNGELPFLLKVLSVNKALSIQAHPDQNLAKVLHNNDPEHYKDPNHKPEMTIALTEFEMLCCFKKDIILPQEIVVELNLDSQFIKDESSLREIFSKLMKLNKDQVTTIITQLVERINYQSNKTTEEELVLRLNTQYGNDVGVLCPFVMNYLKLAPGESVFLSPNEPHSYLFGDCVECMACSDNVVRAGLTPKFRDVDTLIQMLSYKMDSLVNLQVKGKATRFSQVNEFNPPSEFTEFEIFKIDLKAGEKACVDLKDVSIGIIISGDLELFVEPLQNKIEKSTQESTSCSESEETTDKLNIQTNSLHVNRGDSFVIDPKTKLHLRSLSDNYALVFIATPQN